MEILPVIDLLGGCVVRGAAGQRDKYRPVRSVLCPGAEPQRVAAALAGCGFSQCYVADLDAIQGGRLAAGDVAAIADAGLAVWLDAGLGAEPPDWPPRLLADLAAVVVGAETAPDERALRRHASHWGERAVFSLDLHRGTPLGAWRDRQPLELAELAVAAGFRRMIVLDLAQVGMGGGAPTLTLCEQIHRRHRQLELTSGGGVRDSRDLPPLEAAGCRWALVASALHSGAIRP